MLSLQGVRSLTELMIKSRRLVNRVLELHVFYHCRSSVPALWLWHYLQGRGEGFPWKNGSRSFTCTYRQQSNLWVQSFSLIWVFVLLVWLNIYMYIFRLALMSYIDLDEIKVFTVFQLNFKTSVLFCSSEKQLLFLFSFFFFFRKWEKLSRLTLYLEN